MTPRCSHALDASVLVLNKFYMAVHVVPARRAFCLLFKGLADVVTVDDGRFQSFDFDGWFGSAGVAPVSSPLDPEEDYVRTIRASVRVPRVVRLRDLERLPRTRVKFNRRNIFARDNHRCQYCGDAFPAGELSLDHVLPRSRGGPASWDNIVAACLKCNVRKGGRTPREAGMRLIREPFRPKTNPALKVKLASRRYQSWRTFMDHAPSAIDPV